jgi:hypothetical protein
MGFWNDRHQVRSKSKDLKVKLTSLLTNISHNLHFELLCMSLRKLPVVIHVNITIFGVVIRSLWTKIDLIYKARGGYYIQSLMKKVVILDVWHVRVCVCVCACASVRACVRACLCVVGCRFYWKARKGKLISPLTLIKIQPGDNCLSIIFIFNSNQNVFSHIAYLMSHRWCNR